MDEGVRHTEQKGTHEIIEIGKRRGGEGWMRKRREYE